MVRGVLVFVLLGLTGAIMWFSASSSTVQLRRPTSGIEVAVSVSVDGAPTPLQGVLPSTPSEPPSTTRSSPATPRTTQSLPMPTLAPTTAATRPIPTRAMLTPPRATVVHTAGAERTPSEAANAADTATATPVVATASRGTAATATAPTAAPTAQPTAAAAGTQRPRSALQRLGLTTPRYPGNTAPLAFTRAAPTMPNATYHAALRPAALTSRPAPTAAVAARGAAAPAILASADQLSLGNRERWKTEQLTAPQWASAIKYLWSKILVANVADIVASNQFGTVINGTRYFTLQDIDACCAQAYVVSQFRDDSMRHAESVIAQYTARHLLPIFYVEISAVSTFVTKFIPTYEAAMARSPKDYPPLVIVTGCRDFSFGVELARQSHGDAIAPLLASPAVSRWYAAQCDVQHPKVSCYPLGFAFHDSKNREYTHPIVHNHELDRLARAALPNHKRNISVFVDRWKGQNNRFRNRIRASLLSSLRSVARSEDRRVSAPDLWQHYSKAAFVACPPGGGYDSHRVAEAIVLGAIPILWASSAYRQADRAEAKVVLRVDPAAEASIFDKLPVVFAPSFNNITVGQLEEWQRDIAARREAGEFDLTRLTNTYWVREFERHAAAGFRAREESN